MAGCCIPGCTNNNKKGYSMRRFPKDVKKKLNWIKNINNLWPNWKPPEHGLICHSHFSDAMWEKPRVDGKQKLKDDAEPTIFYNHNVNIKPAASSVSPPLNDQSSTDCNTNSSSHDEIVEVNMEPNQQMNSIEVFTSKLPSTEVNNICEKTNSTDYETPTDCTTTSTLDEALKIAVLKAENLEKQLKVANAKLQAADVSVRKVLRSNNFLLRRIRRLRSNNRIRVEKSLLKSTEILHKVFNDDQIKWLQRDSSCKTVHKWSEETIKKALRLKVSCSNSGYQELMKQNIPLPSTRTLRRRLETITFEPGICDDIFEALKEKVEQFEDDRQRDCMLALDEMSIMSGNQVDLSTNSRFGDTTIPNTFGKKTEATHGLVIMLAGIFTRWKQVVGYYFTPNGFDGVKLKPIIEEIIRKAELIGLYVHSITSDMGGVNQAMWRAFGNVSASRYGEIVNSISHPVDESRRLFFFADAPHLFKNLRVCLINNKVILLPEKFVKTLKLSSDIVQFEHFKELVAEQKDYHLKLAPKLNENVIKTTTFNKMKVGHAVNMLNRYVSGAFNYMDHENGNKKYETTAKFTEIMSKWFGLITARSPMMALGKKENNERTQNKFNESIQFLNSVIELFRDVKIGSDQRFKPVQRGILITTKSVIELTNYLINKRGYSYVLAGRFSQDCVENLFSNIRKKFPIPNALQFKHSLKVLMVSQYLQTLQNTNYDQDEGSFIADFLRRPAKTNYNQFEEISPVLPPGIENKVIGISKKELNSLYGICGYILTRVSKLTKVCKQCINSAGSTTYNGSSQYSALLRLRCYKPNTLFFVNDETFRFFYHMEIEIRRYLPHLKYAKVDFVKFYIVKLKHIQCDTLLNCHNIFEKIMKRFILYRVKIECKKGILNAYNSKTMSMHSIIK